MTKTETLSIPALLQIVSALTEILEEEPHLLRAAKSQEHAELLRRKQDLFMQYNSMIETLSAMAREGLTLDGASRTQLTAAVHHLAAAADANAIALQGAMRASQNMLHVLMTRIKKETRLVHTYQASMGVSAAEDSSLIPSVLFRQSV